MCTNTPEKPKGNVAQHFADWDKKLYHGHGYTKAYTRIINAANGGPPRCVYGRRDGILCFYVELQPADEWTFLKLYADWAAAQPAGAQLTLLSDPPGDPPPTCGSANNAPPC
ncbi:MAG TPA: hypothetical protein VKE22_05565 [Haliangiales bacterium]|nr:hypothetical protein [Haliangiales bacterium]